LTTKRISGPLNQNGAAYAWGNNGNGQLGDGTTSDSSTPSQVAPDDLTHILAVAAGNHFSYALDADGSLWACGRNGNGQLGLGPPTGYYTTPQRVTAPAGYKFTSIDAESSEEHAVATVQAVPTPSAVFGGVGLLGLVGGVQLLRRRHKE